jgi:hypothetical protein
MFSGGWFGGPLWQTEQWRATTADMAHGALPKLIDDKLNPFIEGDGTYTADYKQAF